MEENKLNTNESKNETKTLLWYYFYNFIIIPLIIWLNISEIITTANMGVDAFTVVTTMIYVPRILFEIIVFICMIAKKRFTLKLLKISIYVPSIIYIILIIINICTEITNQNFSNLFVYIIFILTITAWMLLNVSYFEDRKEIFKN